MPDTTAFNLPSFLSTRWRLGFLALFISLFLGGCAVPLKSNLESFPPMANDKPPGASQQAINTAKGMGRGINFGNMLEAPKEGVWGFSVSTDLVNAAVAGGFTTVRLPVRWSNHALALPPYTLDITFTRRVENVVDALLAKGLFVVLNMHHYRHFDGDAPDAEDMALQPNLADERFLVLWQQIAQRFKGRSDRLLFELYNEPHGRLDAARWNDMAARALAVVRASNPERVVLIGPVNWNNASDLSALRLPNDPHLITTIHNYAPFKFTHQGAFWIKPELPTGLACCDETQRAELLAPLDLAKAWSTENRYPVFLGEFGVLNAAEMPARVAYTQHMRQQAELRGFPWAYWELASHFGLYDVKTKRYEAPLLKALMGPDEVARPGVTAAQP